MPKDIDRIITLMRLLSDVGNRSGIAHVSTWHSGNTKFEAVGLLKVIVASLL